MRDKVSQEEEKQMEKVQDEWRWRGERRGSAKRSQKMGWKEKYYRKEPVAM